MRARRGARGGYWLARPAEEITLANVIRAVEGPLANIQDGLRRRPSTGRRRAAAATSGSRSRDASPVLENVTIADLRDGTIPADVLELTRDEGARITR